MHNNFIVFIFDLTNKNNNMIYFKAIVTEKGPRLGQAIGNTKSGTYKGMERAQFEEAIKNSECYSFEIISF